MNKSTIHGVSHKWKEEKEKKFHEMAVTNNSSVGMKLIPPEWDGHKGDIFRVETASPSPLFWLKSEQWGIIKTSEIKFIWDAARPGSGETPQRGQTTFFNQSINSYYRNLLSSKELKFSLLYPTELKLNYYFAAWIQVARNSCDYTIT